MLNVDTSDMLAWLDEQLEAVAAEADYELKDGEWTAASYAELLAERGDRITERQAGYRLRSLWQVGKLKRKKVKIGRGTPYVYYREASDGVESGG